MVLIKCTDCKVTGTTNPNIIPELKCWIEKVNLGTT